MPNRKTLDQVNGSYFDYHKNARSNAGDGSAMGFCVTTVRGKLRGSVADINESVRTLIYTLSLAYNADGSGDTTLSYPIK